VKKNSNGAYCQIASVTLRPGACLACEAVVNKADDVARVLSSCALVCKKAEFTT
jgi:hypothetical protein